MRTEVQKVAWRAYWPTTVLAVTFLIVYGITYNYLNTRQRLSDARAERQRQAICAILANIPGHIPPEIARARQVFARPAHRGDCQPIPRPTPRPTPAPTVTVTPTAQHTVVVRPGPTVTRTARPTSRPSATPTKHPSPSPSRTCVPLTHICS